MAELIDRLLTMFPFLDESDVFEYMTKFPNADSENLIVEQILTDFPNGAKPDKKKGKGKVSDNDDDAFYPSLAKEKEKEKEKIECSTTVPKFSPIFKPSETADLLRLTQLFPEVHTEIVEGLYVDHFRNFNRTAASLSM